MKELIEEYGGILTACFMGLMLLGLLTELSGTGGGLYHLARSFAQGIGSVCGG